MSERGGRVRPVLWFVGGRDADLGMGLPLRRSPGPDLWPFVAVTSAASVLVIGGGVLARNGGAAPSGGGETGG